MVKDHFFQFLLRFEFKTSRYRTTVNYLNHELAVNGEYHCACPNDFLADKCGTIQCASKGEWNRKRCEAISKVEIFLQDLEHQIKEIILDKGW